jgi:alanine-synthesizing transaminase
MGWRDSVSGFVAGNKAMVNALATIKGYYDYGIFQPVQIASIIAMRHCDKDIEAQNAKYQLRRDVVCEGLRRIGWAVEPPRASMFVWTKFPVEQSKGKGSIEFAMELLENAYLRWLRAWFGENGSLYADSVVENEHVSPGDSISSYVQEVKSTEKPKITEKK